MGDFAVLLNGIEVTPLIRDFSLEWRQNGRSAGAMKFADDLVAPPTFEPEVGQTVAVFHLGTRIWSGSLEAHTLDTPRTNLRHGFRLVSLENIFDRLRTGFRSYHRERFTAEPNFDILTAPGHTFVNGYQVAVTSDGTLPFGLDASVAYWVVGVNGDDLQLSQSESGPPIDFTDGGTGPHYLWWYAGYIVRDLIAQRAQGENLNVSLVQIGIPLDKRIYPNSTLTEALEELAGVCGYTWSVDEEFRLRFAPRDYSPAAFSFAEPDTGLFHADKTATREDFANVVQLKISWAAYTPTEDIPALDGSTQEFELSFTPEEIVAVLVNGESARFGVENVDAGLDFYWNPGEKRFVQEPTAAALTAGDVLVIQYRVLGGNVIEVSDEASIAARAAMEGNGGRYELFVQADDIVTVEAGQTRAQAILAAQNQINRVLNGTVKTMKLPGITAVRPSQLVDVTMPRMGIAAVEQYIVDTVTMRLLSAEAAEYRLRLLSGERLLDEVAFFKALASGGRGITGIAGGLGSNVADSGIVTDAGEEVTY